MTFSATARPSSTSVPTTTVVAKGIPVLAVLSDALSSARVGVVTEHRGTLQFTVTRDVAQLVAPSMRRTSSAVVAPVSSCTAGKVTVGPATTDVLAWRPFT